MKIIIFVYFSRALQRGISSKEFFKLTNGYQPNQLKYQVWKLFDEFDADYDGILTFDTANAPRKMRFGSNRNVSCQDHELTPAGVVHKDQVGMQFESSANKHESECKVWGVKVTSVSEILGRRNKLEGKPAPTAEQIQRSILGVHGDKVYPTVPSLADFAPHSPSFKGAADLGANSPAQSPETYSPIPTRSDATGTSNHALCAAALQAHTARMGGGPKHGSPPPAKLVQ